MDWVLLALAASVMSAVQTELNHHFKIEGTLLVFWRSVFGVLLLAPLMLVFPMPSSGYFYVIGIAAGVLSAFSDKLYYNAARQFGGRLAVMYLPIKIFGAFVLWSMIDPGSIASLVADPLRFAGVISCLMLSCVALMIMRQHDVSWQAFLYVIPVGIILTLCDIAAKLALQDEAHFVGGVVMFTMLMMLMCGLITGGKLLHKRVPRKAFKAARLPALYICLAFCAMVTLIIAAIHLTPNPGYTNALALMAVVWLMAYNRLRGKPDGNPISALMLVGAAAGIVILV